MIGEGMLGGGTAVSKGRERKVQAGRGRRLESPFGATWSLRVLDAKLEVKVVAFRIED